MVCNRAQSDELYHFAHDVAKYIKIFAQIGRKFVHLPRIIYNKT